MQSCRSHHTTCCEYSVLLCSNAVVFQLLNSPFQLRCSNWPFHYLAHSRACRIEWQVLSREVVASEHGDYAWREAPISWIAKHDVWRWQVIQELPQLKWPCCGSLAWVLPDKPVTMWRTRPCMLVTYWTFILSHELPWRLQKYASPARSGHFTFTTNPSMNNTTWKWFACCGSSRCCSPSHRLNGSAAVSSEVYLHNAWWYYHQWWWEGQWADAPGGTLRGTPFEGQTFGMTSLCWLCSLSDFTAIVLLYTVSQKRTLVTH